MPPTRLPKNAWATHYDLTLDIVSEQAESAYLVGNFDLMETQIDTILQNAKEVLHTTKAYIIKIQAYISLLKIEKALDVALEALGKLGIKLDKMPSKLAVVAGLLKTKFLLRKKTPDILENLPLMTAPLQIAQMLILSAATSAAYFLSPNLFPLIIFKQLEISVKYGNCPDSSYAYSTYGVILSGVTNEFAEAQKFGDLALKLIDKYNWDIFIAKVHFVYGQFVSHWTKPYTSLYHYNIEGLQKGLETGNFLFGAYCGYGHSVGAFHAGMRIPNLIQLAEEEYLPILQKTKQTLVMNWLLVNYQTLLNFSNSGQLNLDVKGLRADETQLIQELEEEKEYSGLCGLHMYKMMLHYFMGSSDTALTHGEKAEALIESVMATTQVAPIIFYHTLTLLRLYESKKAFERLKMMFKIKSNLKKLKLFATAGAENYAAKYYLVEAELARINKKDPVKWYQKAIDAAHKNTILHEEALAHELLGRFYWQKKEESNAKTALLNAESLPKMEIVPQDMGRVFINLINNAFYAVNERNKLSVPIENETESYTPRVTVSTQQHGNQIIITVKDNGTGMPESVKAKIFQPFFNTKPTGQGTGLGLSLANDIVTKGHGGTLDVESTEGVGTKFIIGLPIGL